MIIYIIIYSLIIGSFLNVCIYRLPIGESIVYTPSHCMHCNHRLGVWDLFPVLSYVFLGGKCRYCGGRVSCQYPLIELANVGLYTIIYLFLGLNGISVLTMGLASSLIVIFMIDMKYQLIPDGLNIFIAVLGVAATVLDYQHWIAHVVGLFIVSGLFYLIALLSKGEMGGGDIKLMAAAGLFLGWDQILMAMVLAALVGTAYSVPLMILKRAKLKTQVPFGPFLAIGIYITSIFGHDLINLYINLVFK